MNAEHASGEIIGDRYRIVSILGQGGTQKRSKNYERERLKVAPMHRTSDNTRKDFHFKQAHALCDAADRVFMEDLTRSSKSFGEVAD